MAQSAKLLRLDDRFSFRPDPLILAIDKGTTGTGGGTGGEGTSERTPRSTIELYMIALKEKPKKSFIALYILPYDISLARVYGFEPDRRIHCLQSQEGIETRLGKALGRYARRTPQKPIPAVGKIPEVRERFGEVPEWYIAAKNVEKVYAALIKLSRFENLFCERQRDSGCVD